MLETKTPKTDTTLYTYIIYDQIHKKLITNMWIVFKVLILPMLLASFGISLFCKGSCFRSIITQVNLPYNQKIKYSKKQNL